MDLSKIMSISGKPGLFKMVGQTKSGAIVESLLDQKRFPVFPHDKISSLEEISIFTTEEDLPLKEVFRKISEKESAGSALDPKAGNDAVWKYFAEVLPDFDKDRVYVSDIRKVLNWYNLLTEKELLDFTAEPEEKKEETPEESTEEASAAMTKVIHDLVVVKTRTLKRDFYVQTLIAPEPLPVILPGQFAEIEPPGHQVFLRRPFSFYDIDYKENTLSFLFKVVGNGTRAMASAKPGDTMNTIYPLGKGYTLPEGNKALLAGGGTGIAPMLILGKYLLEKGITPSFIFGGRSQDDIVDIEVFKQLGEVNTATEDGSLGHKGLITQHPVFANLGSFHKVYCCGPDPMMHAIGLLAQKAGIACEVSLENTMACGIGACLCCIVETREGNVTSCTNGPVFNVKELVGWDQQKHK